MLDGLGRKRQHMPDSRVPGFFLRGSASSVMGLVKRMVVLMGGIVECTITASDLIYCHAVL